MRWFPDAVMIESEVPGSAYLLPGTRVMSPGGWDTWAPNQTNSPNQQGLMSLSVQRGPPSPSSESWQRGLCHLSRFTDCKTSTGTLSVNQTDPSPFPSIPGAFAPPPRVLPLAWPHFLSPLYLPVLFILQTPQNKAKQIKSHAHAHTLLPLRCSSWSFSHLNIRHTHLSCLFYLRFSGTLVMATFSPPAWEVMEGSGLGTGGSWTCLLCAADFSLQLRVLSGRARELGSFTSKIPLDSKNQ